MNENINLCEILRGLEGIELWSSLIGNCIFKRNEEYGIAVRALYDNNTYTFESNGKYYLGMGECILFPSKDQRDWSKFERPIKEGTPMMCRLKNGDWVLRYYVGIINGQHRVYRKDKTIADGFQNGMIPYDKFNPNNIEESLKYNIQK